MGLGLIPQQTTRRRMKRFDFKAHWAKLTISTLASSVSKVPKQAHPYTDCPHSRCLFNNPNSYDGQDRAARQRIWRIPSTSHPWKQNIDHMVQSLPQQRKSLMMYFFDGFVRMSFVSLPFSSCFLLSHLPADRVSDEAETEEAWQLSWCHLLG